MRVYNFSPGPSTLPEEILRQAQQELLDWKGLGYSTLEISHHDPAFVELLRQSELDLRSLLNIPSNYQVLFLQGGGRSQFSMVPLNLLRGKNVADYLETGLWSHLAIAEATRYCQVNVVASNVETQYTTIPAENTWHYNPNAAYFYYVDNETVNGIELVKRPLVKDIPLVCDMSSSLLSRSIDVSQFGLIFAAAQKNVGPAGLTIVIVREDLLDQALPITPIMFNYSAHAKAKSLYNTIPTFILYMISLMFQWVERQGGVAAMEAINLRKSRKLYDAIDTSDCYINQVDPHYRSRMNVVFHLADERLNEPFLQEARAAGLAGLKGHKTVGGMRASLYNAMPEAGVDALVAFMRDFAQRRG
ncbi:MAG: 3-phosphoserine/phosphohydroxythreonine transaminase [Gammaproteobacteria bacterium]